MVGLEGGWEVWGEGGREFDYMKQFVFNILQDMDLDSDQHRVGVTTFANDVRVSVGGGVGGGVV